MDLHEPCCFVCREEVLTRRLLQTASNSRCANRFQKMKIQQGRWALPDSCSVVCNDFGFASCLCFLITKHIACRTAFLSGSYSWTDAFVVTSVLVLVHYKTTLKPLATSCDSIRRLHAQTLQKHGHIVMAVRLHTKWVPVCTLSLAAPENNV